MLDFYIESVDPGNLKVDKSVLQIAKSKQNKLPLGIIVTSSLEYANNIGMLSVITHFDLSLMGETARNIATFRCFSYFMIADKKALTKGATQSNVDFVEMIVHMAQAHAYGAFTVKAKKEDVPAGGLRMTPRAKLLLAIKDLLDREQV